MAARKSLRTFPGCFFTENGLPQDGGLIEKGNFAAVPKGSLLRELANPKDLTEGVLYNRYKPAPDGPYYLCKCGAGEFSTGKGTADCASCTEKMRFHKTEKIKKKNRDFLQKPLAKCTEM